MDHQGRCALHPLPLGQCGGKCAGNNRGSGFFSVEGPRTKALCVQSSCPPGLIAEEGHDDGGLASPHHGVCGPRATVVDSHLDAGQNSVVRKGFSNEYIVGAVVLL